MNSTLNEPLVDNSNQDATDAKIYQQFHQYLSRLVLPGKQQQVPRLSLSAEDAARLGEPQWVGALQHLANSLLACVFSISKELSAGSLLSSEAFDQLFPQSLQNSKVKSWFDIFIKPDVESQTPVGSVSDPESVLNTRALDYFSRFFAAFENQVNNPNTINTDIKKFLDGIKQLDWEDVHQDREDVHQLVEKSVIEQAFQALHHLDEVAALLGITKVSNLFAFESQHLNQPMSLPYLLAVTAALGGSCLAFNNWIVPHAVLYRYPVAEVTEGTADIPPSMYWSIPLVSSVMLTTYLYLQRHPQQRVCSHYMTDQKQSQPATYDYLVQQIQSMGRSLQSLPIISLVATLLQRFYEKMSINWQKLFKNPDSLRDAEYQHPNMLAYHAGLLILEITAFFALLNPSAENALYLMIFTLTAPTISSILSHVLAGLKGLIESGATAQSAQQLQWNSTAITSLALAMTIVMTALTWLDDNPLNVMFEKLMGTNLNNYNAIMGTLGVVALFCCYAFINAGLFAMMTSLVEGLWSPNQRGGLFSDSITAILANLPAYMLSLTLLVTVTGRYCEVAPFLGSECQEAVNQDSGIAGDWTQATISGAMMVKVLFALFAFALTDLPKTLAYFKVEGYKIPELAYLTSAPMRLGVDFILQFVLLLKDAFATQAVTTAHDLSERKVDNTMIKSLVECIQGYASQLSQPCIGLFAQPANASEHDQSYNSNASTDIAVHGPQGV